MFARQRMMMPQPKVDKPPSSQSRLCWKKEDICTGVSACGLRNVWQISLCNWSCYGGEDCWSSGQSLRAFCFGFPARDVHPAASASEPREDNFNGFKHSGLEEKPRIWPDCLYTCRIRSTAVQLNPPPDPRKVLHLKLDETEGATPASPPTHLLLLLIFVY